MMSALTLSLFATIFFAKMAPSPASTSNSNSREADSDTLQRKEEHKVSQVVPNSPYFTIKDGPKGRGLFATQNDIPFGTLLHVAPTISISALEYDQNMKFTILEHYLFKDKGSGCGNMLLALGYGSLFNH
jgi:hypothetical protein